MLEEQHAKAGRAQIGEWPRARHEDAEDGEAEVGLRLPRIGLRRMPRGNVANLVTKHAGEL